MVQGTIIGSKRVKFGLMVMLCFAMIISLFGLQMNTAKVYATIGFSGGNGTAGNPFLITTPEQLNAIRYGTANHYKLGNNIDLTDYLASGGGGYNSGAFWAPISNFTGTFDGDGYVIRGLKINRSSENFVGFFGGTGAGATIKNIGLDNVDVVSGSFVGGLVGGLQGSGATLSNSYVTGSVSGTNYIGGLVGYQSSGSVSDSYSSATVTGSYTGGLVGYQDNSSISNSYATGLVTGGYMIGGLVGGSPTGIVTSSFYDQSITSENFYGKGTPKSTLEMQTQSTFGAWDFVTVWFMPPNQYPQLRKFMTNAPVATPDPAGGPVARGASVEITSGTAGASIYYTTNGDDPTTSSTLYSSPVVVEDDLTIKAIAVSTGKLDSEIMSKSYTIIRPAAPTTGSLMMGTTSGTTALIDVTDAMEYKVNSGVYKKITDTSVDNISVNAGDTISVRIAASGGNPATNARVFTVGLADIRPAEAPTGTLTPGSNSGTTKLSNVTSAMEYSLDADDYTKITTGSSVDNISVNAGDTIYVRIAATKQQPASDVQELTVDVADIKPAEAPTGTLSPGSNSGTTKLSDVTSAMEYSLDADDYTRITTGSSVDNISVNAGDTIYVRIAATAQQPASNVQELTVDLADIKPAEAPTGTLTPGSNSGTTKVSNITNAMEYSLDADVYTRITTGSSVDNISVNAGDTIYVRIAATAQQPASYVQELTVGLADIKQASAAATLTSTIGTVSTGGTATETITNIPFGTTLAALKAAITPAANASFEVYNADGTSVATTLATGKKVIVTAQDGTTKVTYTVTVNAQSPSTPEPAYYPVTSVSLDQTDLTLTAGGQTAVLHATINPAYATIQSLKWSSSDPEVATVDEKGVVTPIAAGSATITVTTTDQAKTATSQVKVVDHDVKKLVGLEVSEKTILLKPNKSSSITVHAIYSDGTKENITKDKEVTYLPSSRSIVTVTKGVIKARNKEGNATITIAYQGKKVEIPVWISKLDVNKLEVQPTNLQVEVDQVEQLQVTATLSNKETEDVTEQAIWESSEPKVATIDPNGKLTAIAPGTAVIIAAYGGKTTEITVEVSKEKRIKRLAASKQKVTVTVGKEQSVKLTATYQDHSKKVVTEQAKWSSEDETIAIVSNGVIIGQAKGTVKIKAKYKGKTVAITVTVTE
ncbi:UNVERIFIED_CONTAM: uncharacterized protein YjdB [Brevibacillus sp. OAP136]